MGSCLAVGNSPACFGLLARIGSTNTIYNTPGGLHIKRAAMSGKDMAQIQKQ